MVPKNLAARYGRVGLLLAAFALVAAIIVQPLWRKLWPAPIMVTDGGPSRAR
jgi:hypothetical protein